MNKVHRRFRNKSFTIVGVFFAISILIAGLVYRFKINYYVMMLLIIIMYMVKYMCMVLYYVLIKKYLANFIGKKDFI